mmetsp:Transcript_21405/g.44021  ORF Transcript_21405/g.44021 Transcript_21405/m.44021 type:complete len:189 (+) Transcript_21405:47-613(+)
MKFSALILAVVATISVTEAFSVDRRGVFKQLASAGAAVAVVAGTTSPANALDACPKGSKNCIATQWSPPAGTDAKAAASTLEKIIASYPQEGQNKVDLGGWAVVDGSYAPGSTVSLEYTSGIGNFAKFFNGGKPFVDDMKLAIGSDGVVGVRSSSRIGDSDLGVNEKRLSYFVASLRKEGWAAPDPAY